MQVPVESWQDIVAPQAMDLVLMAIFVAIAMTGFFLKSVRLKYATLVLAVGYMGFSKSHLISVVDLFGVLDRNLPIAKYNIGYYLFGAFVIVSTVLWGRVYCGRICAFGAMTQLMDAVLPGTLRFEPPPRIERHASRIKYALLALVVVYFLATRDMQVYRYVEPFWMFGLFGTTAMWIGLALLLVATVFVRNLLLPVSVPRRRTAGHHLEPHGVQDQALVRMQDVQDLREDLRVGRDPGTEDHRERVRALRRLRAPLHGPEEVPALDHPAQGASVGDADSSSRVFRRGVTSTSFVDVTMTASTPGRRLTSAIPSTGPSRNTPVDSPSASVAFGARTVTLRHP